MFEKLRKPEIDVSLRLNRMTKSIAHFAPNLVRLFKNKSGIGGVEFALLAPVLLLLYFGTFELTVALTVVGKVSRSSSSIADLVASQNSVDKTFLSTMPDVLASIMAPYTASSASTLKISGVTIDAAAKATIAWSWDQSGGRPYAVGATTTVPTDLQVANTYLIRSELAVPYNTLVYFPGLPYSQLNSLTFTKVYYFAPRTGTSVNCTNC